MKIIARFRFLSQYKTIAKRNSTKNVLNFYIAGVCHARLINNYSTSTSALDRELTPTKTSPENISSFHLYYFATISTRSASTETANYPGTKLVGVAFNCL